MHVKAASYVGNGTSQSITDLGFTPVAVMIKRRNSTDDGVIRTDTMSATKPMIEAAPVIANAITSLDADGFSVGGDSQVNANAATYIYVAFGAGATDLATGTFTGDGLDNRAITVGFQPDLVIAFNEADDKVFFLMPDMGTNGARPTNGELTPTANTIQTLDANGFTVGSSENLNDSGVEVHWLAIKEAAGIFKVLTYQGNGVDNRSITGVGFQPTFVWVTPDDNLDTVFSHVNNSAGTSQTWSAAQTTNHIQAFEADGFQVGNSNNANHSSGIDHYAFALKDGTSEVNEPILDYTGEGGAVAGGVAGVAALSAFAGEGGAVAGGVADAILDIRLLINHTGEGGAVVGGEADVTKINEYTGSAFGGAIAGGAAAVAVHTAIRPGISTVDVYNPAGVLQGSLTPLSYRISRYENQVGAWACNLPVDEEVSYETPLAAEITYGWKISITQENFAPNNAPGSGTLLYQGIVEERQYQIDAGGNAFLALKGSFRTYQLVRRSVLRNLEFNGSLAALTNTLVGTLLDPDGPIVPASAVAHVAGTYTDLSRYEAWIKGATLGRHAVRETWDNDRPELVRFDGPPDSGLTFRLLAEGEERYQHDSGVTGVALIAGTPLIRFDGSRLVNRIIAKGVDTVEDPDDPSGTITDVLTLQHATFNSPYTVKAGVNPDATFFYYIEDEESIERYGLTELVLTFSEVKNPNDDATSRSRAANVLYMKAVNELINRRSEKVEVAFQPIANGSRLWALPGDSAMVEYHGEVETEGGPAVWLDMSKRMLITERHDESHPSGIRRVSYKLAAPEMEFPVPGLPGEISLPPEGPGPDEPGGPDGPSDEPCCEDPNADEGEGPDDEFGQDFPPQSDLECFRLGGNELSTLGITVGVPWHYLIDGDPGLAPSLPTFGVPVPDLGEGTWHVRATVSYRISGFHGPGTFEVRLNTGSSFSFSGGPGDTNLIIGSDGQPFVPTVADTFAAGSVGTVIVSIVRTAGTGLISRIHAHPPDVLELCFEPADA